MRFRKIRKSQEQVLVKHHYTDLQTLANEL